LTSVPAIDDQDCKLLPGGNVSRLALHRQGQDCLVRRRARSWRGSMLIDPDSAGPGHRRAGLLVQPSTGRRSGFLAALADRFAQPRSPMTTAQASRRP
jgi:hypothetical protein